MNAHDIFGNKVVQAASVGVVSFAAGGVLGYMLGKRSQTPSEATEFVQLTLDTKDYEAAMTELEGVITADDLELYSEAEMAPTIEIPTEDDEDEEGELPETGEPIEWLGPDPRLQPPAEEVYVDISNVFDQPEDEWDEEEELSNRTNDAPHIIKVDEFISNETGFSQTTLTYYSADEVVADECNVPVYDYNKFLGDNLKFGHGSGNVDVVYIRNVQKRAEFEVIRFDGSHQDELLGLHEETALENELRHSVNTRRFRSDD